MFLNRNLLIMTLLCLLGILSLAFPNEFRLYTNKGAETIRRYKPAGPVIPPVALPHGDKGYAYAIFDGPLPIYEQRKLERTAGNEVSCQTLAYA